MEYFKINPLKPDIKIIDKAVKVLRNGGIIVYPTDTLYGLGVDIYNEKALNKLYLLKRRDIRTPVSLLVHSIDQIEKLVGILPIDHYSNLKKLLPGKITILMDNKLKKPIPFFNQIKTSEKIGIRIPDHAVCRELSSRFGGPISTTSANISGKESVLSVQEVIAHFGNKLDLIMDAGRMESKAGSTTLDFTKEPILVLREGDVTIKDLRSKLPSVNFKIYKSKFLVTFVCSGNICRSIMAEFILKAMIKKTKFKDYLEVKSAGTLNLPSVPAHEYSIEVASENDVDISSHRSTTVSASIMDNSELVVCMAMNHYQFLRHNYPQHRQKIILLKQWGRKEKLSNPSIADPIGHNLDFFRNTFKEIRKEVKRILPFLFADLKKFIVYNDLK